MLVLTAYSKLDIDRYNTTWNALIAHGDLRVRVMRLAHSPVAPFTPC